MSVANFQLASSIAKNYTGSLFDLIKTGECSTKNDYLIATAVRKDTSSRNENIHKTHYMVAEHQTRLFQAKDRFDRVNGRLPMNMILSQTARREDSMSDTITVINAEHNQKSPVFEDLMCTHVFPKNNIKPWNSKPLKSRNKVNRKVFVGPSVTEVIQDRYSKLYRNESKGKLLISKHPKQTAVNRDIDENPIEGDEFPNAYSQSKIPKLHVRWEDESPMGHDIAVPEVVQNLDYVGPNCVEDSTSSLPEMLTNANKSKSLPLSYSFSRYNELYSENKLPNKNSSSSCLTDTIQNIGKEDYFPGESVGVINKRKKGFLDDNTYSSENCFLQTIDDFNYSNSLESIINRQEYKFSQEIPKNENINENDSLRLSADLFENSNSDAESITDEEFKSNEIFDFESSSSNFSLEDDLQITTFKNQNFKLFHEMKSTPIFSSGKKYCGMYVNEGEEASSKEKQRKFYVTDPDDLLKTPTNIP